MSVVEPDNSPGTGTEYLVPYHVPGTWYHAVGQCTGTNR